MFSSSEEQRIYHRSVAQFLERFCAGAWQSYQEQAANIIHPDRESGANGSLEEAANRYQDRDSGADYLAHVDIP